MNAHVPPAPVRDLPKNIEIEQNVLGALFENNALFARIGGFLEARHFSEELHQRIYEVASSLIKDGKTVTVASVKTFLPDIDLGGVSVWKYLVHLYTNAPGILIAEDYARMIVDLHCRRSLIEAGTAMVDRAYDLPVGTRPGEIAVGAIGAIQAITEGASEKNTRRDAGASSLGLLDHVRRVRAGEVARSGVTTGIPEIDRDTGGFMPGTLWVVGARPGMGKAQPLHSKIKTETGWTDFANVKAGDRLASVDGAESVVTGIFPQGVKKTYRVTFSDGRSAECCAEHLWEVRYRDWAAPKVLETSRLIEMLQRVRYRGRLMIRRQTGDFGTKAELPLSPWAVGALLANGCLLYDTPRFSSADEATVERLNGCLAPLGVWANFSSGYDYYLTSGRDKNPNGLASILKAIGMQGKPSHEKFIPPSYLLASRAQRIELLQGLMDCDGWVEKNGCAQYASASEQLAKDVQELARSLGYWAKIAQREAFVHDGNGGKEQKRDSFKVVITGPGIEEIVSLPRKLERLENRSWFRTLTVESIEPLGEEDCVCISVSHPSRLYLTDDYVITHNTVLSCSGAVTAAKSGAGAILFSLEVPEDQVNARVLSDMTYSGRQPIQFGRILRADIDDQEEWRLDEAQQRLSALPLVFDVAPRLSITEIALRVKSEKERMAKKGVSLGVVFIDYLKFVKASDRYRGQRVYEVGEISAGLKELAKSEGVCVVLLAQLNRALENRDDKRPMLSDLRESGDLEADADVVAFIHREAYYLQASPEFKAGQGDVLSRFMEMENVAEIAIAKNRAGAVRSHEIWCDVSCSKLAPKAVRYAP